MNERKIEKHVFLTLKDGTSAGENHESVNN
jgi:hypothetical protein